MADLPTNLKDDILDSSVNTRRKYRMIENGDGTYSFEDATEYRQVGDEYGAGLINETNKQVNARVEKAVVVRDLDTIGAITQPGFVPDALALKDVNDSLGGLSFSVVDGEPYVKVGADSPRPFNNFVLPFYICQTESTYITLTTNGMTVFQNIYDFSSVNSISFSAGIHSNATSGILYIALSDTPLTSLSEIQSCENNWSFTMTKTHATPLTTPLTIDTSAIKGKKYINFYSSQSATQTYYLGTFLHYMNLLG